MDLSQFKDVFLGEAQDIVTRIEQGLVDMEKAPDDKKLQTAFRDFHTLKGNAATMGLDKLAQIAHAVEDLLDVFTQTKTAPTPEVLQLVLEALDPIRALLDEFRDGKDLGIDVAPSIARLKAALPGKGPAATAPARPAPAHPAPASAPASTPAASTPAAPAPAPSPASTPAHPSSAAAHPSPAPAPHAAENAASRAAGTATIAAPESKSLSLPTVRVGLKKLDAIMNLVEELTVVKARLLDEAESLKSSALQEEIKVFERLIKQLQQGTLETRLISVSDIFQGYRRVVRDTARSLGKEVDFVVEDNGISIDRVLLEKINEPLIHVLRNSVDHGLEDRATRIRNGKHPTGTVTLRARREQGYALVEVLDDGAGMNAAGIKKKAIELGVITQAEADAMTDQVARYLVCHPNFSTRDAVTEISGRGVGMDVVQKVMDSVNGRLEIESEPGAGSRIALYLPLNLAIIQALMLRAGGQNFAAPLSDVLEIISFDVVPTSPIENEPVVHLRGEIIPVLDLAGKFGLQGPVKGGYGVIVRTIRGKLALRVEALLGRNEIVVKNFEGYLKHVDGINSATIMGDGRVVLILDLRGLR
jgi:two-component system chemotaxis sensor kinase CheA